MEYAANVNQHIYYHFHQYVKKIILVVYNKILLLNNVLIVILVPTCKMEFVKE